MLIVLVLLIIFKSNQDYTCFGLSQYHRYVCFGHGICIAQDNCECDESYMEVANCSSENYCSGYSVFDYDNVCSGRGFCIGNNTCYCDQMWIGDNCETPYDIQYLNQTITYNPATCFNISGTNETACSGHGRCLDYRGTKQPHCYCFTGWTGSNCSTFIGILIELPGYNSTSYYTNRNYKWWIVSTGGVSIINICIVVINLLFAFFCLVNIILNLGGRKNFWIWTKRKLKRFFHSKYIHDGGNAKLLSVPPIGVKEGPPQYM